MILISSCLAGIDCNYKGESKPNNKLIELIKKGKAIPICPEQLGGLPTPRSGARILSGNGLDVINNKTKLITDKGEDVTNEYIRGANEVLKLAKLLNASAIILKQGSPSCGCGKTQGGKRERKLVNGDGVAVALLKKNGIKVYNEEIINNKNIWRGLSE
jgi:uncharacterized protein YbbK (DUF523 family)